MSAPEWGDKGREYDDTQTKPKNNFENSEKKPILVLVGGGTSSGKTTLGESIGKKFKSSVFSLDDFYKGDEVFRESSEINFDFNKPEKIEKSLLMSKLKDILLGKDILLPKLTSKARIDENGRRTAKLIRIDDEKKLSASKIIIVEGVHALQHEELRNMADLKVFADTSDDFRLMLKIMRSPWYKTVEGKPIVDWRNFGKSSKEDKYEKFAEATMDAFNFWKKITKPSETKYVLPTKQWADLIISGSGSWESFEQGLDKIIQLINLYFQNEEDFKKQLEKARQNNQKVRNTHTHREREREREHLKATKHLFNFC